MSIGDGTMSMMWMRMPGQTWLGAAASFVVMWTVMMAAMMLPSLLPMLRRYRRAMGGLGAMRLAALTALVSIGYLFVWTMLGALVFPFGAALAALEMREPTLARLAPVVVGVVVILAGVLQRSAWKARRLACCRAAAVRDCTTGVVSSSAWRHGVRLGVQCVGSCSALLAIQLVVGVMDVRAMGVVTAVVAAERLAPSGERVARAIGMLAMGAGVVMIVRAAAGGLG